MKKNNLFLFLLVSAFCIMQSCKGEDPFRIDYSEVPPAFNASEAVRDSVLPQGVKIYVVQEGDGQFQVTFKDVIDVKYTGRTAEGEIFESSYAIRFRNDADQTQLFQNLYPYTLENGQRDIPPLVEGLRKGLIGMRPGEKRIIVVPPELGTSRQLSSGLSLEGKTLVYDIELLQIAGVPRDKVEL